MALMGGKVKNFKNPPTKTTSLFLVHIRGRGVGGSDLNMDQSICFCFFSPY